MKHQKYHQIIAVVVGSVLLISLCSSVTLAGSQQSEPIKLKVQVLPYLSFAPFFIAQEEGYFSEQGLEIEFVKMNAISQAIPALLQGDLDVITGDIRFGVLNAMKRGGIIKIVADKGYLSPTGCTYLGLVTRQDLVDSGALKERKQLKNKRIASTTQGSGWYYVEKLLNTVNLSTSDVLTDEVPVPARLEALKTGKVDLINIAEPWITRALRMDNTMVWVPAQEVVPNLQLAMIFYGPNLLQHDPEAGQQFMVAYLEGVRQYAQGKTGRNVEIMMKYTGLSRDLVQEACWPAIHDEGTINIESVIEFQQWGIKHGLLDSLVPQEQFWESRFIEYANQRLHTLSK